MIFCKISNTIICALVSDIKSKKGVTDIKIKLSLPFVAVAVVTFLGVVSAFVCCGVFTVKNETDYSYNNKAAFERKNILVAVKDPASDTLNVNMLVCFNPNDKSIKTINIPADTRVKVAFSDQMFKHTLNIGGVEMMREQAQAVLPINIDYHLVINTTDLYCPDGDYRGLVNGIFSHYLWQQEDLTSYLSNLLNASNTDLSLFKVPDYVEFINRFSQRTNEYYTIPGSREQIGDKSFFISSEIKTSQMINQSILN